MVNVYNYIYTHIHIISEHISGHQAIIDNYNFLLPYSISYFLCLHPVPKMGGFFFNMMG